MLAAEGDSHTWRVENGVAVLPVTDLREVRLGRLLLDGQLVELHGESARRAESLDACRRALSGWTREEPCERVVRRAEAAKRCDEFWTSARELEARVLECGAPR